MPPPRKVKLEKKLQVKNASGLHTRPATVIVKQLQLMKSTVTFTYRNETVDARSVLNILMLSARKNSRIIIVVEGEELDAHRTMEMIVDAFETNFGE